MCDDPRRLATVLPDPHMYLLPRCAIARLRRAPRFPDGAGPRSPPCSAHVDGCPPLPGRSRTSSSQVPARLLSLSPVSSRVVRCVAHDPAGRRNRNGPAEAEPWSRRGMWRASMRTRCAGPRRRMLSGSSHSPGRIAPSPRVTGLASICLLDPDACCAHPRCVEGGAFWSCPGQFVNVPDARRPLDYSLGPGPRRSIQRSGRSMGAKPNEV